MEKVEYYKAGGAVTDLVIQSVGLIGIGCQNGNELFSKLLLKMP